MITDKLYSQKPRFTEYFRQHPHNYCPYSIVGSNFKPLITVTNDWAKILDKGGQVDTFIFLLRESFRHTSHESLKCKLCGYGSGEKTLICIDFFCMTDSSL